VVDGPFSEAEEVVVGCFVLDAASLTTRSSGRRRHELERLRVVRPGPIEVRGRSISAKLSIPPAPVRRRDDTTKEAP